jgi:hypothetical protein
VISRDKQTVRVMQQLGAARVERVVVDIDGSRFVIVDISCFV